MTSLSVTSRGTLREKLEWTFRIYDIDGDGGVTEEEITQISKCMREINSTPEEEESTFWEEDFKEMFHEMDVNKDGILTVGEFIEGVTNNPAFADLLNATR